MLNDEDFAVYAFKKVFFSASPGWATQFITPQNSNNLILNEILKVFSFGKGTIDLKFLMRKKNLLEKSKTNNYQNNNLFLERWKQNDKIMKKMFKIIKQIKVSIEVLQCFCLTETIKHESMLSSLVLQSLKNEVNNFVMTTTGKSNILKAKVLDLKV